MLVMFLKSTLNTIIAVSLSFLSNYLNFKCKIWNKIEVVITLDMIDRLEGLETHFEKHISFGTPVPLKDTSVHL